MREIVLDNTIISDSTDAFVIAELGNNHQGSVEECKKLISAAHESGADAVKLQKRANSELFTKSFFDSPYQNNNSYGETYGKHREYLELDIDAYKSLQAYAQELGLSFFVTPFDHSSVDALDELDLPFYKVASGDLTNLPLIQYIAERRKPIIFSTGGASLHDVERAYDEIKQYGCSAAILQCTAAYPSRSEDLNLQVIKTIREKYPESVVGYSGHDNGIVMPVVAYVLGARIIEKHFTLDRTLKGTDHVFSLTPTGFKNMVRDLHRTKQAIGDGVKRPLEVEHEPIRKMSKKLVAARDIQADQVLTKADVIAKSPGGGILPSELGQILGKKLTRSLTADDAIEWENLE